MYAERIWTSITCKNPIIAWKPPIIVKSRPYWKEAIDTRVHADRHFQLATTLELLSRVSRVMARRTLLDLFVSGAEGRIRNPR